MASDNKKPLTIAVAISGGGTTLRNLIENQNNGTLSAQIVQVISSSPTAKGLEIARAAKIETDVVDYKAHRSIESFSAAIFEICRQKNVQIVVMGGFLKKVLIPPDFENRVINIHPSLIPNYCGKGFYGLHVHRAVIQDGLKTSGCTVHIVDDQYDHGPVIAQETVPVEPGDTPESLAARVFEAECKLLPDVINELAAK